MSELDQKSRDYVAAAQERVRRRSGAYMAVVIGPAILLLALVKILEDHDYPQGDIRNEPAFWAIFGLVAFLLIGTMMLGSLRYLLRGE
jgi:hypothetical protein